VTILALGRAMPTFALATVRIRLAR
jgi:hypothetical protein